MAKASTAVEGAVVSNTELTVQESKFRKQSQSLYQQAAKITVTDPESLKSAIRAEVNAKKEAAVGAIVGVRVWSTEETDY